MSQALDFSLARPDPAAIVAAGYVGVLRYVAPEIDAPKIITATEYENLIGHDLKVVLNWEWYGNRAREGAAAGTADAQEALRQANALGYHGAIYFSVDFDAAPADQPAINAYFQAAAQVIGLARLGAYGGYWPLSRLFDAGLIRYGWQTFAWSGGNREARAHLYQNGAQALGACDVNDILKEDWTGNMVPTGWTDDPATETLTAPNGQSAQYGVRKFVLQNNWQADNVPFGPDYADPASTNPKDRRQDFMCCSLKYTDANEMIFYAPVGQELKNCQAQPPPPASDPKAAAAKAALQAWLAE